MDLFRHLLRFLPALLWMAVIYRTSATPGLKSVPLVQGVGLLPAHLDPAAMQLLELLLRKSAHLFSYGLLAVLLGWAFFPWLDRRRSFWAALVVTVLFAISDEYHQSFVPNREGRWYDVAIDTVGAVLGLLLLRPRRQPTRSPCNP
ncbi:MAG: VanZ family protein [Bacillota bacterium]